MYRLTLFIVVLLVARPALSNEADMLEQIRQINADPDVSDVIGVVIIK